MRNTPITLGQLCKLYSVLPVLLLGLLGLTQSAQAQSAGVFVATGKPSVSEDACSATRLRDGRVLFAGSRAGSAPAALSEIYDPSTGTFTRTSSMISARCGQSATLLPDGRVLVAGGYFGNSISRAVSSAELYDPSTGTFQSTGDMITAQFDQTAILLGNGQVLMAGGNRSDSSGAPAEMYDPATGKFARTGAPGRALQPTATLLADGKVLLVGHVYSFTTTGILYNDSTVAELYDPAADTISTLNSANLPQPLYFHTATLLVNGKVLIAGGSKDNDGAVILGSAELYDPSTATFSDTGRLVQPRAGHTATILPGGKVFVSGNQRLTELYDPALGTFGAAGSTLDPDDRWAIPLADGTVLLKGRSSAELYIPSSSAVSAASLTSPFAPASLASLFGARLTADTASAGQPEPPSSLGGISLAVRDSAGVERLARLLYVSPSQINFEVPPGTALGDAVLEVVKGTVRSSSVTAQVRGIAPGLFESPDNKAAAYAVRVQADGSQTFIPFGNSIVLDDRPVYLILFGTGIRNRASLASVRCAIGGISMPVEYAGPSGGGLPGLDQVNVRLTADVKGTKDGRLVLTVDGIPTNTVLVDIR